MQFCDLNKQYKAYKSEIDAAIQSVINSSHFINGAAVSKFEDELSEFVGVKHAIACSSGTDALLMPLMAYGLQPEDEVICPAFSYIASASMVSFLGAKPVFVDVSPLDFNIDVSKIEEKITSKTRGIIPVSLFGQCANIDEINTIAKKYNLWVMEDGAQSFGATLNGKKSCSMTDVATTSFFPAKPLGCYGDGGAIFTDDDELAKKLKLIRAHGREPDNKYVNKVIGINGRIDTIQAAILSVKLKYFSAEVETRQKAAELYSKILNGFALLPEVAENKNSTWAQFTIGLANRDEVKTKLAEKNIPTVVHYPLTLPKQKAFEHDVILGEEFEVAELLSQSVLSLPMHGFIESDEVELVAKTLIELLDD